MPGWSSCGRSSKYSPESQEEDFPLEKSVTGHVLTFPEKETDWIELSNLIKADDPSPFPAPKYSPESQENTGI